MMDSSFILSLIDKFNAGATTELKFNDGVNRLFLRKDDGGKSFLQTLRGDSSVETPPSVASENAPKDKTDDARGGSLITSPIVATFYASPGPNAAPFVVPGSKVKAGETLCILEAMKMMNKLEAEFDMEILSVEAKNGDLVEFNQTLFKAKPI
ncbi:MAG: acetyl-CoA carboxylase biotin carboxyl carrier protein subunit [Treponema sp.]|nr:acetyl-CoA carboxylase biotin carboxyl carrier protein subunit [Treponema sp.]